MADNRLDGPTTKVPNLLLHELFEKVAVESPNCPALYDAEQRITFKELNERANLFSRMIKEELSSDGISHKESLEPVVCLMMSPSIERIVAILAIFKLGAAYLPLDANLPVNRIIHILRESHPICLISSSDNASVINNVEIISEGLKILEFDYMHQTEQSFKTCNVLESEQLGQGINPLACVLYTSGTTGVPKGVRLRHRNIMNRLSWQWRMLPFVKNDVGCAKTSLMFVDSVTETLGCLLKGVPLVIVQKAQMVNTEQFMKILEKFGVSRLILVPSLLKKLILMLQSGITPVEAVAKLKLVVSSGELLPPQLAIDFFRTFSNDSQLANFYGSTEVTGDVTYDVFSSEDEVRQYTRNGFLSIGVLVDNCTIHLLDQHLKPVEDQETDGEIVLSGLNVADGYMHDNQSSFVENNLERKSGHELLYRTGDYGTIFDGRVYYRGRKDSIVKIRGQRVSLPEIERIMNTFRGVDKTVVLFWKATDQNQTILAFVLPKQDAELDHSAMQQHCQNELPEYMVPQILILKEFPLQSQSGKIDEQKMLEIYQESLGADESEEAVEDTLMESALAVVASVLGRPRRAVKATDNFFQIGGNSINAISVIVKLKEAGIHVDTSEFLAADSIKDSISKSTETMMQNLSIPELKAKYAIRTLQQSDLDNVVQVIGDAFIRKDGMTNVLHTPACIFQQHLRKLFPAALASGLSVIVYEKITGKIIGADLFASMEICQPPEDAFSFSDLMKPIGDFLEYAEAPLEGNLKGRWLTGLLGATDLDLTWQENVEIFYHMEMEVIKLATAAGYNGIEVMNTHPVTVSLATHYLGYETCMAYQINQFELKDGRRPFEKIPDDSIYHLQLKHLKKI